MDMHSIAKHVRITGRVQGVAYRAWAQSEAQRLGLTGWVRNKPDGSVEAIAAGPDKAVEQLITACWSGPGSASVRDVQAAPADDPALPGFEIRR
ncbi:hypothetical protein OB2597_09494 [Pseudooceanicola batsensis HTCC2597]|uniref:acylphosphatase n=2 Tax=Pseudooceanicola batsensis TaxID=314255 RepID=A3TV21_PSEBH|nr:hypothetical protein OB2597_09494 [Pseudooceanicola batsensis HTCC2597]